MIELRHKILLAMLLLSALASAVVFLAPWGSGRGCIDGPADLTLCAASDMARITGNGSVPLEGPEFDLGSTGIQLHGARNEVLAFQIVLSGEGNPQEVSVTLSDLTGPEGTELLAEPNAELFLAHFVEANPGGHTWGPPSEVLPWPALYPDALIPFQTRCGKPRTLVETFPVPHADHQNQIVWFDLYLPRGQKPGTYYGKIQIKAGSSTQSVPLQITVWDTTLSDENTYDAVAEIYDPYQQEGAHSIHDPLWKDMASCYQRLAHRHRATFLERTDAPLGPSLHNPEPDPEAWAEYDEIYAPTLDGTLFSSDTGYVGPGEDIPVRVWRTPWPQPYNENLAQSPSPEELQHYTALSRAWNNHALSRGWTDTAYFAYIFDEVDGPSDERTGDQKDAYIQRVHGDMKAMQKALDAGSPDLPISLLWTGHTDPAIWEGQEGLDLQGTIRHWAPNAAAANPSFFQRRRKEGERVWFYHAGHPHAGTNVINAHGSDLRTWGVIAARYQLSGTFMWAANLGDPENPYKHPSYKKKDDRFGNGTLVYPGARLDLIGYPSTPGPIPSMRLKMWRRGLQDAELAEAARKAGYATKADWALEEFVLKALGDAERGEPTAWPRSWAAWSAFKLKLLKMASP